MLLLQHVLLLVAFQTFDAASVKPVPTAPQKYVAPSGGPGTKDPSRIRYPYTTLKTLLMAAYDVQAFQIDGPAWLDSERYEVDATLPADATKEQFRAMLQTLLTGRFRVAVQREIRQVPGYTLGVARKGAKLTQSAGSLVTPDADAAPPPLKLGPDRYFVAPARPGMFLQLTRLGARSTFQQVTMAEFAAALQNQMKHPVVDATGLPDKYDFVLSFSTEGLDMGSGRIPVSGGDTEAPPDISAAVQKQLGLKLESKKVPVEIIVTEHADRLPTGN